MFEFNRNAIPTDDAFDLEDEQQDFQIIPIDLYRVKIDEVHEPDEEHQYIELKMVISEGVTTGTSFAGKELQERFYLPSERHKDGGKFCEKRIAILCIAADIYSEEAFKKGESCNPDDCEGKQIIVRVKHEKWKTQDDEERHAARIDGLHLYSRKDKRIPEIMEKWKAKKVKMEGQEKRDKKFSSL